MEISELFEENIGNQSRYSQVEKLAIYILEEEKCDTAAKALSTIDFQKKYTALQKSNPSIVSIPLNSIAVYLSKVSDGENRIYCEGKKQGYYLRPIVEQGENDKTQEVAAEEESNFKYREECLQEKSLYPVFIPWLDCVCDRAFDISNRRKMHKWGNPDLLGIRLCSIVGVINIEITTIEVKKDIKNWRVDIFEAVAHTIFANKVYFAFECQYEDFRKEKDDMVLYAQQYNIGILARFTDIEDSPIQEIMPAPTHSPNIFMQKRFLDALEFTRIEDIFDRTKTKL